MFTKTALAAGAIIPMTCLMVDAFYWKDRFNLSEMKLNDLFMRIIKKGKTGVWYGKRLKELYGKGRGAPSDMPISEKTKFTTNSRQCIKINEKSSSKDWLTSPDIALFAYGFYNGSHLVNDQD